KYSSGSAEHQLARVCEPRIVAVGCERLDVARGEVHQADLCEVGTDALLAVGDERRLSVRSGATISVANPGIGNHGGSAAPGVHTEEPSALFSREEYLVVGGPGARDSGCHVADRCRRAADKRVRLELVVRQEAE